MKNGYVPTIGIECHVQLKTKTKLFAAVANDARDAAPNTLISHICMGMPGAMPYLNEKAVELSCKAAFALGTKPQKFSKFDRKHYFYPDLPKGYQISQFSDPIVVGGQVDIEVDGEEKRIGIVRAHLEEDAGKTTHPAAKDYSLVDLNRAGTPLLEIVSEPDMHTAREAKAYAQKLYLLMKYADISDVDLYHGNMRFDVNVSLSNDPKKLGTRTETKNLNSFKAVEKAVEYEIKRQAEVLSGGGEITQETRGWDDAKQKTTPQRGKEEAHDYRYFPDPDIPPLNLSDDYIAKIKESFEKKNFYTTRKKLEDAGHLSEEDLDTLFNNPEAVDFAVAVTEKEGVPKGAVAKLFDWLINFIPSFLADYSQLNEEKIDALLALAQAFDEAKLVSTKAKEGVKQLFEDEKFDTDKFISSNQVVSDEGEIEKIVKKVIEENPNAAEDIKSGEMKAVGFLVGQVMKESKGKADPALAQKTIKKQLGV
ncbi:MAG TPA: Asp-tRNA(Asn)/Glu-tRNA(Gln) amidotransferase subunit GatB [Candidatus Saccharimonadales bacterium]|nr:Asp-tRNA(Asn)/Glu-tRNA(Gln) amidotransferase subunit GatB [Candidatus Saccharimonadales bacterium]